MICLTNFREEEHFFPPPHPWAAPKILILDRVKGLANRFILASKKYSWFNKVVNSRPCIKQTSWKGNDMLLKVDYMYSLLIKPFCKWLLPLPLKKRDIIKIINGLHSHLCCFHCYLGTICKRCVINLMF